MIGPFVKSSGGETRGSLAAHGEIRTGQWAHFDECVSRRRITRCPFEWSIQVWHVDDDEPAEEFLRLGIRAVMHPAFSVSDRHHSGRLRRLQTCPCDRDARSPQGLPISHTSGLCVWVLELVNSLFVHMHKTDRVSQENIAMRISLLSIQPSSPVASAWGSRTPAPPRRRRWTSCAVAHNDSSWCVLTKQDVTESGFAQMRRRQTKRRGAHLDSNGLISFPF